MFEGYSDRQLYELIKMDDKKAFDALFLKQYPILCAYCTQYVSYEDGQEIVQDVMLWLWENRKEVVIEQSIGTYLFRAVKYKCLTLINRNIIKERITSSLHKEMLETLETPDFYVVEELTKNLENALKKLPESYREAFIMNRFHHKTYQQIAEELNVSKKTIDYRIQQALKLLRIELKEYLPVLVALSIL